ncbi:MAG: branched-chain amino acid ABC transporter permease [Candidimonas sp.]|nr:MAG: branched-chain amino acid ABC transporter permease [Candidimonas sp.]
MSLQIFGDYLVAGLMLGMIYALVALGFSLFFGVLDVIQFAHGDILMVGAFAALTTYHGLAAVGVTAAWAQLTLMLLVSLSVTALLGALVAKYLVLPLKKAPPLNTLLLTLMLGMVLRELIRLFYPDGSNSQLFPHLLPGGLFHAGALSVNAGTALLLITGAVLIVGVHLLVTRTKLGLAIRAVAQDSETARVMGINFQWIVLFTFGLGSALAAIAGMMAGLYYNEINFNMGLLLGVIGFSAAVLGGLTNLYGAILGGFLFAAMQTIGTIVLPMIGPGIPSAYKDVFSFAAVILLLAWKPSGLLPERFSERV